MAYVRNFHWMAGVAALFCAVILRPSILRALDAAGGFPSLSPSEARDTIAKRSGDPGFVLLDVRTPKEFNSERIKGAVMVDYLSPSFRDEMSKLDRGKSYLVYCRTGRRTGGALKVMRDLGFGSVSDLAGGITGWKDAGYPTSR